MRPCVVILGVPIDDVTMAEAVDDIAGFVAVGRRTGRWHQITTVNLDFLTNAVRDPAVLGVLQRTALNIPDGMPIIWAARLLGTPLRTRVAGVDLVDALAGRAAVSDLSLYLFGAAPGVAEEAARLLRVRHPGARVHGNSGPSVSHDGDMDAAVVEEIRAARPDVVCVALGNPKQERWIQRHGPALGVPVLIGVGGTFDFIVGRRRRAPVWMQRLGLEWVARAIQEPARLGPRYFTDVVVCVPRFAAQLWRLRSRGAGRRWRPASIERTGNGPVHVRAGPVLDLGRDQALRELLDATDSASSIAVTAVERVDARTVNALVTLARASGRCLRTDSLDRRLSEALRRERLLELVLGDVNESGDG